MAPPEPVTQQQMEAMMTNMIRQLRDDLRNEIRQNPGPAGPIGPPGPPGPAGMHIDGGPDLQRFKIEEFGLFEPDLVVDDKYPSGDMITVGRDTIYRNVDAFCDRIKDAINIKGHETVRENLHMCLRGEASRWWTFELSVLDKQAIRSDATRDLQQWTGRLTTRFRPPLSQAIQENQALTFRISDIRNGKRILQYFQTKILKAKAAGSNDVHSQLMQVYVGLDVALRLTVWEPTEQTTIDQYRRVLQEKETLWIEAYSGRRREFQSPYQSYQPQTSSSTFRPQQYQSGRQQYQTPFQQRRQASTFSQPSPQQGFNPSSAPPTSSITPRNDDSKYCPLHLARGQRYIHPLETCRFVTEAITKMHEVTNQQRGNTTRQIQQARQPQSTPIIEQLNMTDSHPFDESASTASSITDPGDGNFNPYVVDNYLQDTDDSLLNPNPLLDGYDDVAGYLL